MIIGIDASRANTLHRTGVEEYVFQLIQEIKNIHTKASVFPETQDITFVLYTREPLIAELAAFLPEHVTNKVLRWPPRRLWTQVRLSWEMLTHPPDILFVPGHVVPIIHPKKTVMTVHDVAAIAFPESYNWFERWYSLWSAKYAVRKLWKVIVPSEYTKQEFQRLVKNEQRVASIHVVPLAYDKTYKEISDEQKIADVLNTYHIQKPFLLSVGRLELKKNSVRIIQAFELLKKRQSGNLANSQLVLVGGKGYGYEDVEKAIQKSPYKNDIILPGYVSDEHLPYIMNAAEVFVFPSLYEGFGIPILEAFACGTPVVTSNTTSCAEVAGDAAVLVDPLDVERIASGIVDAMKGEKISLALERVQDISWEHVGQHIVQICFDDSHQR